jgi:hypothetical protein
VSDLNNVTPRGQGSAAAQPYTTARTHLSSRVTKCTACILTCCPARSSSRESSQSAKGHVSVSRLLSALPASRHQRHLPSHVLLRDPPIYLPTTVC